MSCAALDLEALVAYWQREGDPAPVEDHVFACDPCAARLAAVAELAGAVAAAVAGGGVGVPLTLELAARLERDGLRLRPYRLRPGERVACTVGADDDLLVSWLEVDDARGAARLDAVVLEGDRVLNRYDDLAFDAARGLVGLAIPGAIARTWPDSVHVVRIVARDHDAAPERLVGEYVFEHTGYRA